jgi:hypothetical protein
MDLFHLFVEYNYSHPYVDGIQQNTFTTQHAIDNNMGYNAIGHIVWCHWLSRLQKKIKGAAPVTAIHSVKK